jgi:hypothetical protein
LTLGGAISAILNVEVVVALTRLVGPQKIIALAKIKKFLYFLKRGSKKFSPKFFFINFGF